MGRIAAGTPISAIQSRSHTISVPPDMLALRRAFRARGARRFDDRGRHPRRRHRRYPQQDTADTGDIVVALIDDEEATLKRLRKRGASIALEAANPAYETRIFGPGPRAHPGQAGRAVPPLLSGELAVASHLELSASSAYRRSRSSPARSHQAVSAAGATGGCVRVGSSGSLVTSTRGGWRFDVQGPAARAAPRLLRASRPPPRKRAIASGKGRSVTLTAGSAAVGRRALPPMTAIAPLRSRSRRPMAPPCVRSEVRLSRRAGSLRDRHRRRIAGWSPARRRAAILRKRFGRRAEREHPALPRCRRRSPRRRRRRRPPATDRQARADRPLPRAIARTMKASRLSAMSVSWPSVPRTSDRMPAGRDQDDRRSRRSAQPATTPAGSRPTSAGASAADESMTSAEPKDQRPGCRTPAAAAFGARPAPRPRRATAMNQPTPIPMTARRARRSRTAPRRKPSSAPA